MGVYIRLLRKYAPFFFAVAAFLGCVLACRPGFSPDGRRILFSVFDESAKKTMVRIYDRKTEAITTLRTVPWTTNSQSPYYCAASWSPSGAQIGLLISAEKTDTNNLIEIIDVKSGRQIRSTAFAQKTGAMLFYPPAFTKDFLLFGGDVLTRYNLRNGRIDHENIGTNDNDLEIYVLNNPSGLHYFAAAKSSSSTNGNIEIGRIDAGRLTRVAEQTIEAEMAGLPDLSPDGKRFAIWKKPPASAIQIWFNSKLEKTITLPGTNTMLGSLIWSIDQKSIFAPAFREVDGSSSETNALLSLIEVPVDGTPVREFIIGSLKLKAEEAASVCQLALSPDGKALALGTPFGSWDKASRPTALYLVELSRPTIKVMSVPLGEQTGK